MGLALAAALCTLSAGCAFARWPVRGPVSSNFGLRFRGWGIELHSGVDIAVPDGTPVHAMAGGTVVFAGVMRGYGRVIILDNGGGISSLYAHLSTIAVKDGEHVDAMQVIGKSGQSGDATGPHLHFEVRVDGRPRDPVPLMGGAPGRR